MKLLDLLVKELPQRGGWPNRIADVHGLKNWMCGNLLGYTWEHGRGDWFYSEKFEEVTRKQYEKEVERLKNITELSVKTDCSFESAAKALMKWINDNGHPHQTIIIDATSAVLYSGEKSINTEEFIKD
jgi:hypothetical protein